MKNTAVAQIFCVVQTVIYIVVVHRYEIALRWCSKKPNVLLCKNAHKNTEEAHRYLVPMTILRWWVCLFTFDSGANWNNVKYATARHLYYVYTSCNFPRKFDSSFALIVDAVGWHVVIHSSCDFFFLSLFLAKEILMLKWMCSSANRKRDQVFDRTDPVHWTSSNTQENINFHIWKLLLYSCIGGFFVLVKVPRRLLCRIKVVTLR